ncbi:MAG TPA: Vi polysaccharide biosynthesis UDP-N-acetylglucosamine C-6 dehydrogenase TviB, partial [Chryseolinea sp.]|nr:Vi polysaccharide biosynthesis UDP-N-acetylglucosamine C-6 dehydrogenase TviB [Chryseolinea sp.]
MTKNIESVGIIGLGYVGLPLAVEFGKIMDVVGFDINENRIKELKKGYDRTHEVEAEELTLASRLKYSCSLEDLRDVTFFIVTVPTPIDQFKTPDLSPLQKASRTVGKVLKKGDIVIYESTVYPGC